MKKELLRMKKRQNGTGILNLSCIPRTDTLRLFISEKEIFPMSYDLNGDPIFSNEQYEMYRHLEYTMKHVVSSNCELNVTAIYDGIDACNSNAIDSIDALKNACTNFRDLIFVLNARHEFVKRFPDITLQEFVLYGRYVLTKTGRVLTFPKNSKLENFSLKTVQYFKSHKLNNLDLVDNEYIIPHPHSICPCCAKKLQSIDELSKKHWIVINDKTYHESCYKAYKFEEQYAKLLYIFDGFFITVQESCNNDYEYKFTVKVNSHLFTVDFSNNQIAIILPKSLQDDVTFQKHRTFSSENHDKLVVSDVFAANKFMKDIQKII